MMQSLGRGENASSSSSSSSCSSLEAVEDEGRESFGLVEKTVLSLVKRDPGILLRTGLFSPKMR